MGLFEAISQGNTEENAMVAHNKLLGFEKFDFNLVSAPFKLTFTNAVLPKSARTRYPESYVLASVATNEIVTKDPTNEMHSLEFKLDAQFEAGDNVAIFPSNRDDDVAKLITRLGYKKDQVFNVQTDGVANPVDLSSSLGNNKCTLEIALTYYFDITNTPSTTMLQFLSMNATAAEDQKQIYHFSSNYISFARMHYTILDVLDQFPSVQLVTRDERKTEENLALFLGMLGPIRPRYYSIANSPNVLPGIVRVIYKVVQYKSKEGTEKHGLCSNFLKTKKSGEKVAVFISKSKFKLPENDLVPLVMVGAGSGISPYFGFLEQRSYNKDKGSKLGRAILIHGCRSESDFAYKSRAEGGLSEGLISDLWPAYSRKQDAEPAHVQDIIAKNGEILWNLLNDEGAVLYICGDIKIGTNVREAVQALAQKHGNLNHFAANIWMNKLAKANKIRHDEWGISTHSGENVIRAARLRLWRKSILAAVAFMSKRTKKQ